MFPAAAEGSAVNIARQKMILKLIALTVYLLYVIFA